MMALTMAARGSSLTKYESEFLKILLSEVTKHSHVYETSHCGIAHEAQENDDRGKDFKLQRVNSSLT